VVLDAALEAMPNFTSRILNNSYYFRYWVDVSAWVGWALCSLHVVLGSVGAGCGVFLVEGDSFCFAHQGELDVDAVEEIGRQDGDIGCAGCDRGEFSPVLANEGGIIDAKAWIEEAAGVNEIEETLLLGAQRPRMFEPLEKAEGFVFVVELVCDCGDGGSAEKVYGFFEAGFESTFYVIGEGDAFLAGSYLGERAEAFAKAKGEGFGPWFFGVSGFELLPGLHVVFLRVIIVCVLCCNVNVTQYKL
jgi:hypothetical protein